MIFLARYHRVVLDGAFSDTHPWPVIPGVPQGTILVPLMTCLDQLTTCNAIARLYADDAILYSTILTLAV